MASSTLTSMRRQISKVKIKWLLIFGVYLLLTNHINGSISHYLSPFNQLFWLTSLHSKILQRNTLFGSDEVRAVVISPDGQTLVSKDKDGIKIWNLKTGSFRAAISSPNPYSHHPAISPDGKTLAIDSEEGIRLLNITTKEVKIVLPDSKGVTSVAMNPDGQTLVGGSVDKTIKIWSLKTGELKTTLANGGSVLATAISSDGQTLVSGSGSTLQIWDLKTGKYKTALIDDKPYKTYIDSIAISPDGQTIVSSNINLDTKQSIIKVWQMP